MKFCYNRDMPSLVFPFHDPKNIETGFLKKILPILKANFQSVFVSITPKTVALNLEAMNFLNSDKFFIVNRNIEDSGIGDHFISGYTNAVKNSDPSQVLHLCTSDRLAFALLSNYKQKFLTDIKKITKNNSPCLFVRSQKAWKTHPRNYQAAESMVTEVGKVLFGKPFDFTWCHLAISAQQLQKILPKLTAHDLVFCAQLVMNLNKLKLQKVDWLSWEDPFILGKDPKQYKIEQENDSKEFEKRMNYVLPEINYLFEVYKNE